MINLNNAATIADIITMLQQAYDDERLSIKQRLKITQAALKHRAIMDDLAALEQIFTLFMLANHRRRYTAIALLFGLLVQDQTIDKWPLLVLAKQLAAPNIQRLLPNGAYAILNHNSIKNNKPAMQYLLAHGRLNFAPKALRLIASNHNPDTMDEVMIMAALSKPAADHSVLIAALKNSMITDKSAFLAHLVQQPEPLAPAVLIAIAESKYADHATILGALQHATANPKVFKAALNNQNHAINKTNLWRDIVAQVRPLSDEVLALLIASKYATDEVVLSIATQPNIGIVTIKAFLKLNKPELVLELLQRNRQLSSEALTLIAAHKCSRYYEIIGAIVMHPRCTEAIYWQVKATNGRFHSAIYEEVIKKRVWPNLAQCSAHTLNLLLKTYFKSCDINDDEDLIAIIRQPNADAEVCRAACLLYADELQPAFLRKLMQRYSAQLSAAVLAQIAQHAAIQDDALLLLLLQCTNFNQDVAVALVSNPIRSLDPIACFLDYIKQPDDLKQKIARWLLQRYEQQILHSHAVDLTDLLIQQITAYHRDAPAAKTIVLSIAKRYYQWLQQNTKFLLFLKQYCQQAIISQEPKARAMAQDLFASYQEPLQQLELSKQPNHDLATLKLTAIAANPQTSRQTLQQILSNPVADLYTMTMALNHEAVGYNYANFIDDLMHHHQAKPSATLLIAIAANERTNNFWLREAIKVSNYAAPVLSAALANTSLKYKNALLDDLLYEHLAGQKNLPLATLVVIAGSAAVDPARIEQLIQVTAYNHELIAAAVTNPVIKHNPTVIHQLIASCDPVTKLIALAALVQQKPTIPTDAACLKQLTSHVDVLVCQVLKSQHNPQSVLLAAITIMHYYLAGKQHVDELLAPIIAAIRNNNPPPTPAVLARLEQAFPPHGAPELAASGPQPAYPKAMG